MKFSPRTHGEAAVKQKTVHVHVHTVAVRPQPKVMEKITRLCRQLLRKGFTFPLVCYFSVRGCASQIPRHSLGFLWSGSRRKGEAFPQELAAKPLSVSDSFT
jgi:hypothetical protein